MRLVKILRRRMSVLALTAALSTSFAASPAYANDIFDAYRQSSDEAQSSEDLSPGKEADLYPTGPGEARPIDPLAKPIPCSEPQASANLLRDSKPHSEVEAASQEAAGNPVNVQARQPATPTSAGPLTSCQGFASDFAPDQSDIGRLMLAAEPTPTNEGDAGAGSVKTVAQLSEPLPTPAKPRPNASSLTRPIGLLTVSPDIETGLRTPLSKLSEEYKITNPAAAQFGSLEAPRWDLTHSGPRFSPMSLQWAAPAVFHNPLYFEQPNLERYGHVNKLHSDCGDCLQSAISAAHFFASAPLLPCKIGSEPPCEKNYVLGSYRPGSCLPHQLVRPKMTPRGFLFQGLATTGLVFFLP